MKLPLTQGKEAVVDRCDYAYLMQWKWHYTTIGYAARTSKKIAMHRVILERMGYKNFKQVDHIDRDKLNNRRSNLRPATASQQKYNQDLLKSNTSGVVGVYWGRGKWVAQVYVNGKSKYIGRFKNIVEAKQARKNGLKRLSLGFPN